MALKLSVNSPYGDTKPDAHIALYELNINFQRKQGKLEIAIWKDKQAKLDDKKSIGIISIPISEETTFDVDEYILTIAFSALKDKTLAQIYTKLKTLKVKFSAGNLDLTQSVEEPD